MSRRGWPVEGYNISIAPRWSRRYGTGVCLKQDKTRAKTKTKTHGGAGASNVGADDAAPGGEDVDDGAVVGVGRQGVGVGGGADGAGGGLGGGRVVGRVGGAVAGGDGEEDAGLDEGGGGGVDGGGPGAAERHVGHGGARARGGVGRHEVDAGDDARVGAGPAGVEHLDRVQRDRLGDPVGAPADGAGDVGPVPVAVGVAAVGIVGEERRTATELLWQGACVSSKRARRRRGQGALQSER